MLTFEFRIMESGDLHERFARTGFERGGELKISNFLDLGLAQILLVKTVFGGRWILSCKNGF